MYVIVISSIEHYNKIVKKHQRNLQGNIAAKSKAIRIIRTLKGIAKNIYIYYGGGIKYLKQERNSWKS